MQQTELVRENEMLRERVTMVEASVQPLLAEISQRREQLHHAYVLCHRALIARDATIARSTLPDHDGLRATSMEAVTAWARTSVPPPAAPAVDTPAVEDAMEAVLEDVLRQNRNLEAKLAARDELLAQSSPSPRPVADPGA